MSRDIVIPRRLKWGKFILLFVLISALLDQPVRPGGILRSPAGSNPDRTARRPKPRHDQAALYQRVWAR